MQTKQECVILLHGLSRTRFSLSRLAATLEQTYQVINQGYPSRQHTVERLAKLAIESAIEKCPEHSTIHFVTHSLGGILVRQYLSEHTINNLGHVVMLGPPNQGSEIVDFFQSSPFLTTIFGILNGPAGVQLGTQSEDRPKALGAVNFSLGIIAGDKNFNPLLSSFLPGQSDGKVTVESSKVDGMADHLVLPVDHTFMMINSGVIRQVEAFLKTGRFERL